MKRLDLRRARFGAKNARFLRADAGTAERTTNAGIPMHARKTLALTLLVNMPVLRIVVKIPRTATTMTFVLRMPAIRATGVNRLQSLMRLRGIRLNRGTLVRNVIRLVLAARRIF